jgi:hypothetical protein
MKRIVFNEDASDHDGAGYRNADAEHESLGKRESKVRANQRDQRGGNDDASDRAGNCYAAHRPQVAQVEVEADAEHQENDADFGELMRGLGVADHTRRLWTQGDPGQEVANDRREAQPIGHEAHDQG